MMKEQLEQLEQETDLETVLEVIELFMHSAPQQLVQMHALKISEDGKSLSNIAHAMKGNMAYLGSKEGWDQCAKIESLCANGSTEHIGNDLIALTAQLDMIFIYLKKVLEKGQL